jgi:protein phosphatase
MKLLSSSFTDIGQVRSENEDSLLCDDEHQLYAVADGIGGLPGGAEASQQAIATLSDFIKTAANPQVINYETCLTQVNDKVLELGQQLSPRTGIGSTLTFAHVVGKTLHCGHIGDSSLMRLRANQLLPLTNEHTVENQLRGSRIASEIALLEQRNALTRCIGQPSPVTGDFADFELEPGDRYLLCTDGVGRAMPHRELTHLMVESPDPATCVRALVDNANQHGGYDNATAVVFFVE